MVLVDGVAAGTWAMTAPGKRLDFGLEPFEAPGTRLGQAIDRRAEAVAALLA